MPQLVKIKGTGEVVSFPDEMSKAEISQRLRARFDTTAGVRPTEEKFNPPPRSQEETAKEIRAGQMISEMQALQTEGQGLSEKADLAKPGNISFEEAVSTLPGVKQAGAAMVKTGQAVKDVTAAYAFEAAGDPESQAKQLGVKAETLEKLGFQGVTPDRGKTPLEEGIEQLPTAGKVISKAAYGLPESAPQMAAVAGLTALGVPPPIAMGLAFGTNEEGFHTKDAAVAALIPVVGQYSGAAVKSVAAKMGVSEKQALEYYRKAGGTAGILGFMASDQIIAIAQLPQEQQKEAWIDALASIIGQTTVGIGAELIPHTRKAVNEVTKGKANAVQERSATPVSLEVSSGSGPEMGGRVRNTPESPLPQKEEVPRGVNAQRLPGGAPREGGQGTPSPTESPVGRGLNIQLGGPSPEAGALFPQGKQPKRTFAEEERAELEDFKARLAKANKAEGAEIAMQKKWQLDQLDSSSIDEQTKAAEEGKPIDYTARDRAYKTTEDYTTAIAQWMEKQQPGSAQRYLERQIEHHQHWYDSYTEQLSQRSNWSYPEEVAARYEQILNYERGKAAKIMDSFRSLGEELKGHRGINPKLGGPDPEAGALFPKGRRGKLKLTNKEESEARMINREKRMVKAAARGTGRLWAEKSGAEGLWRVMAEIDGKPHVVHTGFTHEVEAWEHLKRIAPDERSWRAGATAHSAGYGSASNDRLWTMQKPGEGDRIRGGIRVSEEASRNPDDYTRGRQYDPADPPQRAESKKVAQYFDDADPRLKRDKDVQEAWSVWEKHKKEHDRLESLASTIRTLEFAEDTIRVTLEEKARAQRGGYWSAGREAHFQDEIQHRNELRGQVRELGGNEHTKAEDIEKQLKWEAEQLRVTHQKYLDEVTRVQYTDKTPNPVEPKAPEPKAEQQTLGRIDEQHPSKYRGRGEEGSLFPGEGAGKGKTKPKRKLEEKGLGIGSTRLRQELKQLSIDRMTLSSQVDRLRNQIGIIREGVGHGGRPASDFPKAYLDEARQALPQNEQALKDAEAKLKDVEARLKILNRQRGGESGAIFLPDADNVVEEVKVAAEGLGKAFKGVRDFWRRIPQRHAIINWYQANENFANTLARAGANDICDLGEQLLKRKITTIDEEALSAWIESGQDPAKLATETARLEAALPALRQHSVSIGLAARRYLRAMKHAAKLDPGILRQIANRYADNVNRALHREGMQGLESEWYADTVHHVISPYEEQTITPSAFTTVKDAPTFVDLLVDGHTKPDTFSAVESFQHRARTGQMRIGRKIWIEGALDPATGERTGGLRGLANPADNQPVLKDFITTADGRRVPPDGYETVNIGMGEYAIHKSFAPLLRTLTRQSHLEASHPGMFTSKAVGTFKHSTLLFDTYHMARLAIIHASLGGRDIPFVPANVPSNLFWGAGDVGQKVSAAFRRKFLGQKGARAKLNERSVIRKHLSMLDFEEDTLQRMENRGELSPELHQEINEGKVILNDLMKQGYNLGQISEAIRTEVVRKLPFVGKYNYWLFEEYQRAMMAHVGLIEYNKTKAAYPQMDKAEVARRVALDLNTRFANLRKQSWIKSATGADYSRIFFLAPFWNEGLIRTEFGAVKGVTWDVGRDLKKHKTFRFGALPRSVGTLFLSYLVGNQILSLMLNGKTTWDNDKADSWHDSISAHIPGPGNTPGYYLSPFSISAEITGQLVERTLRREGSIQHGALDVAMYKLSPFGRGLMMWIRQDDLLGNPLEGNTWTEKNLQPLGSIVKNSAPLPIWGRTGWDSFTGQEPYPGATRKQVFASMGIRLANAPSDLQRIERRASEYNSKTGNAKQTSMVFKPGTHYHTVRTAIMSGKVKDAKKGIEELRKTYPDERIEKNMRNWATSAFTGNKARERDFYESLSDKDKELYDKALETRQEVLANFLDLWEDRAERRENPTE